MIVEHTTAVGNPIVEHTKIEQTVLLTALTKAEAAARYTLSDLMSTDVISALTYRFSLL